MYLFDFLQILHTFGHFTIADVILVAKKTKQASFSLSPHMLSTLCSANYTYRSTTNAPNESRTRPRQLPATWGPR